MAKRRRPKSSIRSSSKSLERRLVERSRAFKQNPAIVIPMCQGACRRCAFDHLRRKLSSLKEMDEIRIKKEMNRKGLVGAVAGTISLTFDEKAPYLMIAHMAQGDVSYALKGKAHRDLLIGVQYFDDPFLRLFAFKDIAKRRKLHIYSWDKFITCSDITDPPDELIEWVREKFEITGGDIKVRWSTTELEFGDEKRKSKINTLSKFLQYTALPDLERIEVKVNVLSCKGSCDRCALEELDPGYDEYIEGKIDDLELFRKYREELKNQAREKGVFISGNDCYGDDRELFVSSLEPNGMERMALEAGLTRGICIEKGTPSKLIEALWDEVKEEMVTAVVGDSDLAGEVLALKTGTPSELLSRGYLMKKVREIGAKLPTYSALPDVAQAADEIARAYKAEGRSLALGVLEGWIKRSEDKKVKSVIRAFLLALNAEKGTDWRFDQIETELGDYLESYAKDLLVSDGEKYDLVLREMVKETGVMEELS
jgi:hypothetical protein